jgi:predicted nucleic acid-binding protein
VKLLDTSVAVDYLRGHDPATALLEQWISSEQPVAASELTRFELLAGARLGEHADLEGFFSAIEWIPVTEDITRRAGDFARLYRRSHSGIGVIDYLLAGTASLVGADMVTTNVRHFPMFDGLRPPYHYGMGPTS